MKVNVLGLFNTLRVFGPHLLAQTGPAAIEVTTTAHSPPNDGEALRAAHQNAWKISICHLPFSNLPFDKDCGDPETVLLPIDWLRVHLQAANDDMFSSHPWLGDSLDRWCHEGVSLHHKSPARVIRSISVVDASFNPPAVFAAGLRQLALV